MPSLGGTGRWWLSIADGNRYLFVREHGDELEFAAERLDVFPQGREVQLAAVLELGDVALGDLQLVGELYLEVQ